MSKKRGFTLVELLVVIAIIAVLISMLLPALSRVWWQAQMTRELGNARQFAIAMVTYATNNRANFPQGRRYAYSQDDYVQYPLDRGWDRLTPYGIGVPYTGAVTQVARDAWAATNAKALARNSVGCIVWQNQSEAGGGVTPGKTMFPYGDSRNTELHWTIMVGRSDAYHFWPHTTPAVWYRSPGKLSSSFKDSSRTMFTCRHYLTTGSWFGYLPHQFRSGRPTITGTNVNPTNPTPLGLTVGYVDGSARFAPWTELRRLTQSNADRPSGTPQSQTYIYYDPTR